MSKLTLYDFLRAGHVKRWHIVNTTREQTVADHTYLVTVIALHLYNTIVGVDYRDASEALKLVIGALFHDATEIRTGDIPTPGKAFIRANTTEGIFDEIDQVLLPETPYIGGEISKELHQMIKMADAIEAAHWIRDNGTGRHAEIVAGGCWRRVEDLTYHNTIETNVDWYGPVNEVLMAFGMPHVLKEERITPP